MAEHGFSAETMLMSLQDIRLPAQAPGGILAELFAIVGVGLVLALIIALISNAFLCPRHEHTPDPPMADRIAALTSLPDDDRALALLHLIRSVDPDALPALRATLYTQKGFPKIATLEAVLLSQGRTNA